jgi:hypothetical protein
MVAESLRYRIPTVLMFKEIKKKFVSMTYKQEVIEIMFNIKVKR